MNRLSKCLFIAAATVAMTGVAFAQDPPPDGTAPDPSGDPTGQPPPDGTQPTGAGVEVGMEAGVTYTLANWPKEYVKRTQNIYQGGIEILPRFDVNYSSVDDGMGGSSSSTVTSIGSGFRYGITDKIEALAQFNRIILTGVEGIEAGDRVKGSLTAGAGIVVARGKLDAEVKAALNYDLLLETAAILAGVDVRFNLGPKMWLGTPINRPGLVAFVKGLDLGVATVSPIFFNLPVAFAFQATPELAIQANTALFRLNLNEDAKGGPEGDAIFFFGSDEFGIPLDFDVIYALSNSMDVQANLNLGDLNNAGDAFVLSAGVNIRL